MTGGVHTIGATAAKLANDDNPYTKITVRLNLSGNQTFFGNSDVASDGTNAHGYLVATATSGESWTFGPYPSGAGIKPSDLYFVGTAGDKLFWTGE